MLEVGARALRQQYGKKIRCIIPCNLYGQNDNYSLDSGHVIPSLIHKCFLAKQNNTPLHVWGGGNAEREFLYAHDLGRVLEEIHIGGADTNDMMIVASNEQYTIRSVVEIICSHMGFVGEVIYDTSKPEGIQKKPTSKDDFNDFIRKNNISLTTLRDGIYFAIQDFNRNYPNVRM